MSIKNAFIASILLFFRSFSESLLIIVFDDSLWGINPISITNNSIAAIELMATGTDDNQCMSLVFP